MEDAHYTNQGREQILDLLSRCTNILTLPHVVHQIMEVSSRKNSSASDLTPIIESDPALTARILSVANSSYLGLIKKITSISHAVVVLGFQEIQNLALSMSVIRMFDRRGTQFTEKLWRHSFSVGVAAKMLASYLNLKMDGKYFVSGLLHDVGKIFLCQYLPERFSEMLSMLERQEVITTYHALEEKFFGITHEEIGGRLLDSWMFPREITDAVGWHHEPHRSQSNVALAACVHIADLLCTVRGLSPLGQYYFLSLDKKVLPVLYTLKENFSPDGLSALMAQLDLEIDRQSTLLSAFKW
ncbi:MAG: HDOD domain-containing protein [Desulfomonilia bacterium]